MERRNYKRLISKFNFKEFFVNFLNKSRADMIFFSLVSLFVFIFYWNFNFLKILGILFFILGFVIWALGITELGKSFNFFPRARKLVTSGIYSKIRNPIYFGVILILLGDLIYTIDVKVLGIIFGILLILNLVIQCFRIRAEEKILEKHFGPKYINYKNQTWF